MKKQPSALQKGLTGGLLALMLLTAIPPQSASAQTPSLSELQAQIAQLQALIASLTGAGTGSTLPAYTWTTTLSTGSTGEAVRELQRFLNSDSDTRVALSGAGSPGNETTYYGPATAAAVSKFQMKYRSDILTPNGLVSPTGTFGPSSMAKANALRNAKPTTPTNPTNPTNPSNPDLSGEGELRTVDFAEADDTQIEENADDAVVGELTLKATNGDIRIDRIDLALVADSGNTEKDPWDTFDSISLYVDGDLIETKDLDDSRNDYINRNAGTFRFSGLNLVAEEDEDLVIEMTATTKNSVKGAGTNAGWTLNLNSIRYFDADGVATVDSTTGDIGDSVQFDIIKRGENEELKFRTSDNNPDATTIIVSDRTRTNNVTILEYEIEALDGDITLDTLAVNIETGTAAYADVVQAVRLVIGNTSIKSQGVTTSGSYSANDVLVTFDVDNKVTIDEGDTETIKVVVDLKAQTAYDNGETLTASVGSAERDLTEAEGNDDVTKFSGTVTGDTHRLASSGLSVATDEVTFDTDTMGQNNTTGVFTIEVDVTAVGDDYYVRGIASTTADGSTGGFGFAVDGGTDLTALSATVDSNARETSNDVYIVREGETKTFTIKVHVDPSVSGQYRVALTNIMFSENSNGVSSSESYELIPTNKFRTPYQFINN